MKTDHKEPLFNAIAINIKTNKVRIFGTNKTLRNAEAISGMAIMRRGLEEEFYAEAPSGKYKEGDSYTD